MSRIPDRLWRVVKGHWTLLTERAEDALAREEARRGPASSREASDLAEQINAARAKMEARGELDRGDLTAIDDKIQQLRATADAYAELSEHLERVSLPRATSPSAGLPPVATPTARATAGRDPLAVCYDLLNVQPGADLATLEKAYQARLAELKIDHLPPGSPQREVIENRRRALTAAHERLRDVLNPTETRFEKLEF